MNSIGKSFIAINITLVMYCVPGTPMVTLTATATAKIRSTILENLHMQDCTLVTVSTDRPNIRYSIVHTKKDYVSLLDWLVEDIRNHGIHAPRVLIFCQSKAQCIALFEHFKKKLGDSMYRTLHGQQKDDRTCLLGMYHRGTGEEQKLTAEAAFTSPDSIMRVLLCTSSFGMGVDVVNCHLVIHIGPPKMLDQFLQESGRVGRDEKPSKSVVIIYPRSTSGPGFEDDTKSFIRNTQMCRRSVLMDAIENCNTKPLAIPHTCCDICAKTCLCLCTCEKKDVCTCDVKCVGADTYLTHAEREIYNICKQESETITQLSIVRNITQDDRDILQYELFKIRSSIFDDTLTKEFIMHEDIATGFTDDLIESIVQHVEYIASVHVLLLYFPFFNDDHARAVYQSIEKLFPPNADDTDTNEKSDDECIFDIPSSDSESDILDTNFLEDTLTDYCKPVLREADSE